MIPNAGFAMGRKRSIEMVDDDAWEEQANKRSAFVQQASVSEMA